MLKIFIVEDDKGLQDLYKALFSIHEIEIIGKAYNGEEAISKYKSFRFKPDVILMDHRMPIKDGLETTREILQINEHQKVIFASADVSIREKALALGAKQFLAKPFLTTQLIEEIKKIQSEDKRSDSMQNENPSLFR